MLNILLLVQPWWLLAETNKILLQYHQKLKNKNCTLEERRIHFESTSPCSHPVFWRWIEESTAPQVKKHWFYYLSKYNWNRACPLLSLPSPFLFLFIKFSISKSSIMQRTVCANEAYRVMQISQKDLCRLPCPCNSINSAISTWLVKRGHKSQEGEGERRQNLSDFCGLQNKRKNIAAWGYWCMSSSYGLFIGKANGNPK